MFTLAHLSDIHLSPLPHIPVRDLLNKRAIGYLNWQRGRKDMHRHEVLARLLADLEGQDVDHVAVTGDLVNLGHPAEFEQARDWLARLGPAELVSVVPGNHDAYVRLRHHPGIGLWAPYMSSMGVEDEGGADVAVARGPSALHFPYVRLLGELALVGVSSAVVTAPFVAAGRVGGRQRQELARLLGDLGTAGRFRVLLIHHPPHPVRGNWRRGLRDAADLLALLREVGVELVLHGHNHVHEIAHVETPSGRAPVVGVPSASVARHRHKPLARYNLYRIERTGGGMSCTLIGRGLRQADGPVEELVRLRLL